MDNRTDHEPITLFAENQSNPSTRFGQRPPTVQVVRADSTTGFPIEVTPNDASRRFDQAKVHGAKAALTFVADHTRAGEPTVTIESAARANEDERGYAWYDKLRFQLTASELQLLTCLLLGSNFELSFRNHGDKWCSIMRQTSDRYAGTIRITMGQGDATQFAPRTVAIDFATVGSVTALCLRQCGQLLRVPTETVPTILRAVSQAYSAHAGSGAESTRRVSSKDAVARK